MSDLEVDQQTDRQSVELSIGWKLRSMNRQEFLDDLDLHNDNAFDQEIDAVADLDPDSVASSVRPRVPRGSGFSEAGT